MSAEETEARYWHEKSHVRFESQMAAAIDCSLGGSIAATACATVAIENLAAAATATLMAKKQSRPSGRLVGHTRLTAG